MSRSAWLSLEDIERVATDLITDFADLSFDNYVKDYKVRFIIERGIEIISEASRRLPDDWKDIRPEVAWNDIARIGNHLRHRYQTVDPSTMYEALTLDLPALIMAVESIRAELERRGETPPT